MAGTVLDQIFFILASDTFEGVMGTTHGRSYGVNVKYPEMEGTSATCWVLYGTGSLVHGTMGMSPVSIATSAYSLPELFAQIAVDKTAVVESKQRHGILSGTLRHANFVVYRAPEYMLSGLQDHRKGEHESSTHVAQVTLGNRAVIFWSCPETIGEGSGLRPDYWSGHTTLPACDPAQECALAHLATKRVRLDDALLLRAGTVRRGAVCGRARATVSGQGSPGRWAFARVGDGYVGIWSEHGFEVGAGGQFGGRELICEGGANTWIAECGRKADFGSFDAFVAALTGAKVAVEAGAIRYASPSVGEFVSGWDVTPTVNDEPVQLRGYPLVGSEWAYSAFGSGEMAITYQGERYELWFNQ